MFYQKYRYSFSLSLRLIVPQTKDPSRNFQFLGFQAISRHFEFGCHPTWCPLSLHIVVAPRETEEFGYVENIFMIFQQLPSNFIVVVYYSVIRLKADFET